MLEPVACSEAQLKGSAGAFPRRPQGQLPAFEICPGKLRWILQVRFGHDHYDRDNLFSFASLAVLGRYLDPDLSFSHRLQAHHAVCDRNSHHSLVRRLHRVAQLVFVGVAEVARYIQYHRVSAHLQSLRRDLPLRLRWLVCRPAESVTEPAAESAAANTGHRRGRHRLSAALPQGIDCSDLELVLPAVDQVPHRHTT